MNKKTLNVVSLIAGCAAAAVALFYVINTIIFLTKFSSELGAKYNVLIAIYAVLFLAASALLAIVGVFIIKDFVNKKEEKPSRLIYAGFIFFAFTALINLVSVCFNNGGAAINWVMLVFGVAGMVIALLIEMAKFEGNIKSILAMVLAGLGFVLVIVQLAGGADTLGVFTALFLMALFISVFLYFLFGLLIASNGNNTEVKEVETKEEAEVKEIETKEETETTEDKKEDE